MVQLYQIKPFFKAFLISIVVHMILMHNDTYQHNNCQVHIRAASWRGVKEEKRTLPRNLLTKMVRIRLKTEVLAVAVMVMMVTVMMRKMMMMAMVVVTVMMMEGSVGL